MIFIILAWLLSPNVDYLLSAWHHISDAQVPYLFSNVVSFFQKPCSSPRKKFMFYFSHFPDCWSNPVFSLGTLTLNLDLVITKCLLKTIAYRNTSHHSTRDIDIFSLITDIFGKSSLGERIIEDFYFSGRVAVDFPPDQAKLQSKIWVIYIFI